MKTVILCALGLMSFQSFGQTTVFEKNQEVARYNTLKNISQTVVLTFESTEAISPEIYTSICQAMQVKEGYVNFTMINNRSVTVSFENWIQEKDILDVLNQFGLQFTTKKGNQESK